VLFVNGRATAVLSGTDSSLFPRQGAEELTPDTLDTPLALPGLSGDEHDEPGLAPYGPNRALNDFLGKSGEALHLLALALHVCEAQCTPLDQPNAAKDATWHRMTRTNSRSAGACSTEPAAAGRSRSAPPRPPLNGMKRTPTDRPGNRSEAPRSPETAAAENRYLSAEAAHRVAKEAFTAHGLPLCPQMQVSAVRNRLHQGDLPRQPGTAQVRVCADAWQQVIQDALRTGLETHARLAAETDAPQGVSARLEASGLFSRAELGALGGGASGLGPPMHRLHAPDPARPVFLPSQQARLRRGLRMMEHPDTRQHRPWPLRLDANGHPVAFSAIGCLCHVNPDLTREQSLRIHRMIMDDGGDTCYVDAHGGRHGDDGLPPTLAAVLGLPGGPLFIHAERLTGLLRDRVRQVEPNFKVGSPVSLQALNAALNLPEIAQVLRQAWNLPPDQDTLSPALPQAGRLRRRRLDGTLAD